MGATTLFFIRRNNHILYSAYSDNPIFPATYPVEEPWLKAPKWTDLSVARKVLGCSDEKHIRDRKSRSEWYVLAGTLYDRKSKDSWDVRSPTLDGSTRLPLSNGEITELRLLALALRFSDAAQAVYLARSPWLDAAPRVLQDLQSLPLDPDQWKLESRKLFNISLARMQTDLWYMARGERLDPSIFGYDMLENSPVDPCGMLKVKADGMKNISVFDFVAMSGLVLGLWVLTMEIGDTIVLFWLLNHLVRPAISGTVFLACKAWGFMVDLAVALWSRTRDAVGTWRSAA
ncbi:MAG: hypothetical protein Q9201_007414 [Fulgogasparrea decipioides]